MSKSPKWKPNTACMIVITGSEVQGDEIDVVLAEKLCGEESILITRDSKGRRGEFNLTHRLTGIALLRANKSYEETRRIGELFWSTLSDRLKDVYRTSGDLDKLVGIPYDLKFLLRTGSFPENAAP